jgi:soluble lytic murein transglycosylase-like protein
MMQRYLFLAFIATAVTASADDYGLVSGRSATQIQLLASNSTPNTPRDIVTADLSATPSTTIDDIAVKPVLNPQEVALYRDLFRYARAGQKAKFDTLRSQIKNDVLQGHAEGLFLLSRGRSSSFNELKDWLGRYSDHHQAAQVYELALKRKPRGASLTPPPGYGERKKPKPVVSDEDETMQGTRRERQVLLSRLKTLRVGGRFDEANKLLLAPNSIRTLGVDATIKAGTTLTRSMINADEISAAYALSNELIKMAKTPTQELLWMGGFSAYQRGQYRDAVADFKRLIDISRPTDGFSDRAAYWGARASQALGDERGAASFLRVATQNPYSFYGLLAAEMLGRKPEINWRVPYINSDDATRIYSHSAVQRVVALAQIQETDLAQKELQSNYSRLPTNADLPLLAMALKMELPGAALTLARNLTRQNQWIPAGLYPHSERWKPQDGSKIDPALLFAIMRQESAFKPGVSSRVGARGLMQVMPATASHIRKELRQPPLSREQMVEIPTNLALGQEYLVWMLGEFDGNLMHAMAAYNAGPGNVRKWVAKSTTNDPILFMERIPFSETRKYVEKVMANLWMYRLKFDGTPKTLADVARGRWPIYENRYALAYAAWLDAKRAAYSEGGNAGF